MAYALIPADFTLKKVSKAEKDAVDEYFGREDAEPILKVC